jgi:hypothetical protein
MALSVHFKKYTGHETQGPFHQDELIGVKTTSHEVTLTLILI